MKAYETSEQCRSAMVEQYEGFKPQVAAYAEYATRIAALSEEFHRLRLREAFSAATTLHEEGTLIATIDARETPKSLDVKLAELSSAGVKPGMIIFDRIGNKFYLFK